LVEVSFNHGGGSGRVLADLKGSGSGHGERKLLSIAVHQVDRVGEKKVAW
jgi:hypothetical protein